MAKKLSIRTDTQIKALKPSLFAEADQPRIPIESVKNLYLYYYPKTGRKVFYYRFYRVETGKRANHCLGEYDALSLADAVALATQYNAMVKQGIDPKTQADTHTANQKAKSEYTFKRVLEWWWADVYRANEKTKADNWRKLENHVLPKLGHKPVTDITPDLVEKVFDPIKHLSGSTLDKINRFILATLDFAVTKDLIEYHKCAKVINGYDRKPSKRNPAVSLEEVPQLINTMANATIDPKTLYLFYFTLLTGLRQSEAVNVKWDYLSLSERTITMPSNVMKQSPARLKEPRDHIVYLSDQLLQLIEAIRPLAGHSEFLFPHEKSYREPMSAETLNGALKRNGYYKKQTAHGLRAVFRTFLASKGTPKDIAETMIDHEIGSGLERTYNRHDYIAERAPYAQMVADWLTECGMKIVPLC